MEEKIFEMPLTSYVDKNSREYDLALLEEIKQLSDIPVNKFDALMKKIMRKRAVVNYGGTTKQCRNGMVQSTELAIIDVVRHHIKQITSSV